MEWKTIIDPKPAFADNNIPIALSCSEYYSLYAAAFLKSLVEHSSPEMGYDILIFTKDIVPGTMQMLTNILEGKGNFSLRFLSVNAYIEQYALKVHSHFGVESYFRLLYPYMLKNYDKILYFDCDMVLKTDVAELFSIDIGDAFLGGCLDAVVVGAINSPEDRSFGDKGWKEYCMTTLQMENPYQYLNSGVLIFNLALFRKTYTVEYVLQDIQEKQYYLLDQAALNCLCSRKIHVLDMSWNMTTDVAGAKMPYIKKAPKRVLDAYMAARSTPHTVHYADRLKPWKNPNEDLGYEFWQVARTLPAYTRIVARMSAEQYGFLSVTPADPGPVMLPMGVLGEWKWTIKRWSTKFLPYGSKRRALVKRWYDKLRGRKNRKEAV